MSLRNDIWLRQYAITEDEEIVRGKRRVAEAIAAVDEDPASSALEFERLMADNLFWPGGRVLAGAATHHGNMLNCFVTDGSPKPEGTTRWILETARKLALITKVGGGNGVNLDQIPPKRPYTEKVGRLGLFIDSEHADADLVHTGTFMNQVTGEYETRGYRHATVSRDRASFGSKAVLLVPDSVDGIWTSAATLTEALLNGENVMLDLSDLRAEGEPVRGSGGTSSGPASFAVEVFDSFAFWASLGGATHAGPVATLRYVFANTLRAIRQGGCLHPDTLVNTSRGTLRLSELVDAHQYGWQEHTLEIATDEGFKTSPRGFNNGNAPTLKVKLGNGQEIQGTPQHRLKVLRPDGQRDWVRLDELRLGDHLIQVLDQHTGAPVLLQAVPVPHHNAREAILPELLTESLGFFLGYLWGDGFVSSGRVGLSVAHGSPMMDEVPRLFKELFGLTLTAEQKPADASVVFVKKAAHLIAWLEANGLSKPKARQLELPRAVRTAPRPVVGAFLRGLFEADGSVNHGYPVLSTASPQLAQDVATMLAGLGIPTTQRSMPPRSDRYSQHGLHHVRVVSGKGLERYLERVGVLPGSRLEVLHQHEPDTQRESAWVLPHAEALLAGALQSLPLGAKGRPAPHTPARKSLSRYSRGERNLTARGYERLRQDEHVAPFLPEFAHDEYYVEVESVVDGGRSLTLDLSVNDNKTYLASGFVSHNTRRGAGMATLTATHPDVRDFITCKDLEREQTEGDIGTFNISVLVSDELMRESQDPKSGAAQLIAEIADHAHQTGEPGVIYVDRINEHNALALTDGPIMATNPCVTADTWVTTHIGARQVRDLVGQRFCAAVDGKVYGLESEGFWSTGTKSVFRLQTKRGFELRLTGNHQLRKIVQQTRCAQDTAWTELQELRSGDRIMLQNHRGFSPWAGVGTTSEGWSLGNNVKDGIVTDEVESASYDFYCGFLRGLFDSAAVIRGSAEKGVTVRLVRSDRDELQRVQRMLARLGIMSTVRELTDRRADHELVVEGDNLIQFSEHVGFDEVAKQEKLAARLAAYQRRPDNERFSDEIISITPDGEEEVFDVTVEQVHSFDANGISAHNCGEIPLYPAEPCDLGAINLASHFRDDNTFDFTMLERTTRTAVRFLDNVLTAEIAPLPDIAEAISDKRRIGLGVMGLADMLIRLGLRYDTVEGREFVGRIIGVLRDTAINESCRLGELRGVPAGPERAGLQRRNIALLTVAPTGTTSMLAECSSGVEPVFAAVYTRRIGTSYRAIVHPLLLGLLEEVGNAGTFATRDGTLDREALADSINEQHGSIQPLVDAGLLPDDPRLRAFVVAHDIEPVNHVLMQAAVQRAFDWRDGERTYAGNSISKTINLPNEAGVGDVLAAYELGWREHLKGITVYRDGSRQLQVLTTGGEKKEAAPASDARVATASAPTLEVPVSTPVVSDGINGRGDGIIERPAVVQGMSFKHELAGEKVYVQVFHNQHSQVVEVWTPASKGATPAESTTHEIIGRLASLALKHGAPADSVAASFEGHMDPSGGISQGTGYVGSKWDLVANAIRKVQEKGGPIPVSRAADDECPDCGSTMTRQEGCMTCLTCGYTLCG